MKKAIIIAALAALAVSAVSLPAGAETIGRGQPQGAPQTGGAGGKLQGLPLINIHQESGGVPQRTVPQRPH